MSAMRATSGTVVRQVVRSATTQCRPLSLDEIVAQCKRRGFVFMNSELYGGIATGYDFGPYGVTLKRNVVNMWWQDFIDRRPDCVGLDTSLIMSPKVWQASGHVTEFVDPLTECSKCRRRFRADKLLSAAIEKANNPSGPTASLDRLPLAKLGDMLMEFGVNCPSCGAPPGSAGLGTPRSFNLLFNTHVGPVQHAHACADAEGAGVAGAPSSAGSNKKEGGKQKGSSEPVDGGWTYLRPETAQGAYVQFLNVINSTRRKLPMGVGQVGRSFRNEIAVGNFLFRSREFEQMELQYFCSPSESAAHYRAWVDTCTAWLGKLGLPQDTIRVKEYGKSELAHYALATSDIEFKFPFGWDELWGIANRGSFDLSAHAAASGHSLSYTDASTREVYVPHVVEPALGLNRLLLALLCNGLVEEKLPSGTNITADVQLAQSGDKEEKADSRLVFRVHEDLAPLRFAVLPLLKREPQVSMATDLHARLLSLGAGPGELDVTQAIGKRYRRQDEIGTPLCITVDHASLADGTVTVRHRDSMEQVRVHINELLARGKEGRLKPSAMNWKAV